jgi:hypothetical protein
MTANTLSGLNITDRNTDIPFFPNISWNFTSADFGVIANIPTFSWIQAFFDNTLTEVPVLSVFTGSYREDGTPILSEVTFAYSGEMRNCKGCGIFSTGKNIRNQNVSSLDIGGSATTTFSKVVAWGGMQ